MDFPPLPSPPLPFPLEGITSHQRKGGNLVQWRSSRQDLIAKATCEAELIASSEALQQGENIAIVVAEMVNKSCDIEVSSDNGASLHMIWNGSETAWRTRHISVNARLHQMARRGIKFTYQSTSVMATDRLTKGLGASSLPQIREDLCLIEDWYVQVMINVVFINILLCLVSALSTLQTV